MKKTILIMAISVAAVSTKAQYLIDFETPILATESAWYGQDQVVDGDTIYTQDILDFELNYNSAWGSFSGWSISNFTDISTAGYGNQFSAITGEGKNFSSQYGVCYASEWSNNRVYLSDNLSHFWQSVSVTNTTYAYLSMLNGDMVGKPFGEDTSATGVNDGTNGEDWFLLTIYALGNDSLRNGDSINFYLADYRFAMSANDYIIDSWQTIDLSPLNFGGNGIPKGLDFVLTSSDTTGGFGMNTPAYFAMDDLLIDALESIAEQQTEPISFYPNPVVNLIRIETKSGSFLQLFDLNGRILKSEQASSDLVNWSLENLSQGMYTLIITNGNAVQQARIVKQ